MGMACDTVVDVEVINLINQSHTPLYGLCPFDRGNDVVPPADTFLWPIGGLNKIFDQLLPTPCTAENGLFDGCYCHRLSYTRSYHRRSIDCRHPCDNTRESMGRNLQITICVHAENLERLGELLGPSSNALSREIGLLSFAGTLSLRDNVLSFFLSFFRCSEARPSVASESCACVCNAPEPREQAPILHRLPMRGQSERRA
ncbi:hypothetical protein BS17DRAFT_156551 [Gyrodon lividus]|nr:hypothetical protein BS17DRAFT_156551 [Gyrodon lividus]